MNRKKGISLPIQTCKPVRKGNQSLLSSYLAIVFPFILKTKQKIIMSNSNGTMIENSNTSAYSSMAWVSFGISTVGMIAGILYLPIGLEIKAFFGLGYFYTVSSCFTLAKTLRDKHEGSRLHNRLKEAKTERLLNEYEKVSKLD